MAKPRVLIIVTSHGELGSTGQKTGFWLEELAVPYAEFVKAGADVDIASPKGGRPPVDPKSEKSDHAAVRAFLEDPTAQNKLAATLPLANVKADYDIYFVAGGHGVVWDLAGDERAHALLSKAYADGKVVAAVCHGPAALVGVRGPGGQPLVSGRRVAGFADEEEKAVGLDTVVPFLLEAKLKELGGKYERGPLWKPFAVSDDRLVTGQNPASSQLTAQKAVALLGVARASA
jgi:putative intracellular protease/amidase